MRREDPRGGHQDGGRSALGVLVRRWRERALLTQEELAERSGLNVRTVRRLERDSAARPRSVSVRLLGEALGLDEAERALLATAARTAPSSPDGHHHRPFHDLPRSPTPSPSAVPPSSGTSPPGEASPPPSAPASPDGPAPDGPASGGSQVPPGSPVPACGPVPASGGPAWSSDDGGGVPEWVAVVRRRRIAFFACRDATTPGPFPCRSAGVPCCGEAEEIA
ncbi:multiprotein-bridging factor 1 family protein [Nonomuraea sp. NPDC050783]|uniref:helix-turn-helix domain-containing protein n=1 Tax=Nonomuraea sp. NPDC050783 TaxID=3154634 RepID=UPI003467D70B